MCGVTMSGFGWFGRKENRIHSSRFRSESRLWNPLCFQGLIGGLGALDLRWARLKLATPIMPLVTALRMAVSTGLGMAGTSGSS